MPFLVFTQSMHLDLNVVYTMDGKCTLYISVVIQLQGLAVHLTTACLGYRPKWLQINCLIYLSYNYLLCVFVSMRSLCPAPKMCMNHCFQFPLGTNYLPKRNWKQQLMQILGGKWRVLKLENQMKKFLGDHHSHEVKRQNHCNYNYFDYW